MEELLVNGTISLSGILITIAILRTKLVAIANRQIEEIERRDRQDVRLGEHDVKLVEHEVRLGVLERRDADRGS